MATVCAVAAAVLGSGVIEAQAAPEKTELVVGYVKQADMAPFALALERGYFADEGLKVRLEEARTWNELADRLTEGSLDAGHMLATQPVASSAGLLGDQRFVATAFLSANGAAITVSNQVWSRMRRYVRLSRDGKIAHPVSAGALLEVFQELKRQGQPMQMGVDHPLAPSNYILRYWMAAGGGSPGYYSAESPRGDLRADIALIQFPPIFMPVALRADLLDGYAVGSPWNQQALILETGVPVITQDQITPLIPQTVLGMTEAFANQNPETAVALTKALLRAARDLDAGAREAAVELLRRPEYLGLSRQAMAALISRDFEYEKGDLRPQPRFNIFFSSHATYPYLSDAVWYLTQMRRWGQIAEPQRDAWYWDTARYAYRYDLYQAAASALVAQGLAEEGDFPVNPGLKRDMTLGGADATFVDGKFFDPVRANAYIDSFAVGLKSNEFIERDQIFGVSIDPSLERVLVRRANR